jgi:hypothetical protein
MVESSQRKAGKAVIKDLTCIFKPKGALAALISSEDGQVLGLGTPCPHHPLGISGQVLE